MNLKVYKTGQGYWTRMMSGLGMGLVLVIGVLWLWTQLNQLTSHYRVYIQAVSAVALLLGVGFVIFRWAGTRPKSVDFLIATEGEMKKVNWPTTKEVVGSTWIVIVGLVMIIVIVFLADLAFSWFFTQIGVLELRAGTESIAGSTP